MSGADVDLRGLAMLASGPWQMSYGERAALEGILAQVKPQLAIEIGTAEGGSLSRIAAHSAEVHSFDLVEPSAEITALSNVIRHTGDSHALLPQVLEELAAAGRSIDFILVDGDHSAEGVRRDVEDILKSAAVQRTVIVLHDTTNDVVRSGLASVDYESYDKVALIDFDLVPGYLARREPYRLELWGGLGMIVVDVDRDPEQPIRDDRFHELAGLVGVVRDVMRGIERDGEPLDALPAGEVRQLVAERVQRDAAAAAELALLRERLAGIEGSTSWRATEPLRRLKRQLAQRRAR